MEQLSAHLPEKQRQKVTVGDLLDLMADEFDDNSTVFRRKARWWLNRILEDIYNRWDWPWLYGASTITTQASVAEYPLDEEVAFVSAPMEIEGETVITRRDPSYILRLGAQDATSGTPKYFAQTSLGTVLLWPKPDRAYTIAYQYQKRTEPVEEDTTEIPVPVEVVPAVTMGLIYRLRMSDDRNDPATGEAARTYERMIGDLMWRYSAGMQNTIGVEEGGNVP